MNPIEKRRQRAALYEQLTALDTKARDEKRSLNATEQASWDKISAEVDALKVEIEAEERGAQLEGQRIAASGAVTMPKPVFGSLGEQLMAVRAAAQPGASVDSRLLEVRAALGMSAGSPSDGGFLMEPQYAAGIWQRAYAAGEITRRCFPVPIGDQADSVKIHGIDETARTAGNRWGGVRGYWLAEAATATASAPKFRDIELAPKKLAVLVYVTDEMLRNPVVLESVVGRIVPQEIVFDTEDAILNGDGAGKPLGVLADPSLISVTKEAGQAADTVVAENISNMWARMWAPVRANAVWLVNQDLEPQLDQLSLVIGAGGVPMYLPAGGLTGAPSGMLKGRPVIPVEHCQTVGDKGDIVLAAFDQYALADRGGVQVASSIHVQFLTDQTAFRFLYSVDGKSLWNAPLTPAHGSNTLSPFVTLAERA
jgi:HK97 family phage major capsid protein